MSQMCESSGEKLTPEQAADLSKLLELLTRWENMRDYPATVEGVKAPAFLLDRQRAYEIYQADLRTYSTRYQTSQMPAVRSNTPSHIGDWLRAVRAVWRRAESKIGGDTPVHILEKAYRLADRTADRLKTDRFVRATMPRGVPAAVCELEALIDWCDRLVRQTTRCKSEQIPAFETGELRAKAG
jgi:hypothetical protein